MTTNFSYKYGEYVTCDSLPELLKVTTDGMILYKKNQFNTLSRLVAGTSISDKDMEEVKKSTFRINWAKTSLTQVCRDFDAKDVIRFKFRPPIYNIYNIISGEPGSISDLFAETLYVLKIHMLRYSGGTYHDSAYCELPIARDVQGYIGFIPEEAYIRTFYEWYKSQKEHDTPVRQIFEIYMI